jgi:hypothetical protein
MQIRVENDGSEPLEIDAARLDAPGFSAPAVWERGPATVRAGGTLNLPVALPDLGCIGADTGGGPDAGSAGPAVVELTLGGDAPVRVRTDAADPYGAIGVVTGEACARERVEADVAIVGTAVETRGAGTALEAELVIGLERGAGDADVVLAGVGPTVLLRAPDGAGWVTDASAPATRSSTVRLPLEPARCDAHAIAEDKVGTRFTLEVTRDGEALAYPLPLADGVSGALIAFVAERCGIAPPSG